MSLWKFALAALAFPAVLTAQTLPRFTPESGLWWNPAEDGSGYTIEIQDNTLVIVVYGYDPDRTSAFFLGAGQMQTNKTWTGALNGSTNGQCLTCTYQGRPTILTGSGGTASIVFDTESRGRLTIGTRVIPIERFNFALGNSTEKMLGEWQVVIDLGTRPVSAGDPDFAAYPYFGDIVKFDRVDLTLNPNQYRGCRPSTSLVARCSATDYANHDAAGFFSAASDEQVFVVTDFGRSTFNTTDFFVYTVKAGLNQFDGVMQVRRGNTFETPARMYPVRGFRSASKRFVQAGSGPSSIDPVKSLQAGVVKPGLIEALGGIDKLPAGLSAAEVKSQYGIDVEALEPQVQALIESMR